jgi:hypothetical protein
MKTKILPKRIIFYELWGFSAIVAISWANELGGLARKILGGTYASNWQDAVVETVITVLVAIPTIMFSWRIVNRLHYLEGFLRVCAWCQKVGRGDEWISIEKFVQENLKAQTTHGICQTCRKKIFNETDEKFPLPPA